MTKKSLLLICLLSVVLLTGTGWAATWYVDSTRQESGTGGSWETAFQTIQEAVEAASGAGEDEIWVAGGVDATGVSRYYRLSVPIYIDKPVAIYGGFAGTETERDQRDWEANETTVDGQSEVDQCFYVDGLLQPSIEVVIDGFTITGGHAAGGDAADPFSRYGGGVCSFLSALTVANCTFSGNWADNDGGGMYNVASELAIINCVFLENAAGLGGGGIVNADCGPVTIDGCVFMENVAENLGGGAIGQVRGSEIVIRNCLFVGNSAGGGGAMYIWHSAPQITNCTVTENSAVDTDAAPEVINSGHGGAIYNVESSSIITNSILWGNTAVNGDPAIYNDSSDVSVTYCDVEGGNGIEPNINTDPRFADPANGDYHLRGDSPCIDAGTNSAAGLPVTDFEGDDRILDGNGDGVAVVDMGVDEYPGTVVKEVQIELSPSGDTFVDLGFRRGWTRWKRWKRLPERLMNFGTSCGLSVVRGRYAGHGFLDWRGTLIKFDLPDIPPGAEILEATLFLYHYNVWGEVISVHRMLQDWTEMGATFREPCKGCNPWWYGWYRGNYVQNATDTQRVTYHTRWASWDVTEDVELFLTGTENCGWFLKSAATRWSDWTSCSFYSKEAKQEDLRPFLRIRYRTGEAPSPAPPPLM